MPRSKYTVSEKVALINEYRKTKYGIALFIKRKGLSDSMYHTFESWLYLFDTAGLNGLEERKRNNIYSEELKNKVVAEYLAGRGSLSFLAHKFGIRSRSQVQHWVSSYNKGNKLMATPSRKKAPIMARKTSFEERVEITEYAIMHKRNYQQTAEKFDVSYQQVRSWVLKVDKAGFNALEDLRGRRKKVSELTEVEQLRLEVRRLKAELNDKNAIEEFAKKILALKRKS